jgi:putative tryptophan/tyrosine transport system substrate-binding protein
MAASIARRQFISALGGAAVTWPFAACAQPSQISRIAILETISPDLNTANLRAFRDGLEQLGYTEGKGYVIDYRSADGHTERFPELVGQLLQLHPDVIVTRGTPAALAAKQATTTVPVVMAAIGEPLKIVDSLAQPGGNITGLSALVSELEGKRIELLRELLPGASRIAGFWGMQNPASVAEWKEAVGAAQTLGLELTLHDLRNPDDIKPAFDDALRERAQGGIVGLDTLTQVGAHQIVTLAAKDRLPAIYASKEFIDVGGLIFYGVDYPALYRRAAAYVVKILRGTKPSDLPVEQPTRLALIVNIKAAKALGLTVPASILIRADEVIE